MAFCGGEGLVTSKHTATFIMVCQKVGSFKLWQPNETYMFDKQTCLRSCRASKIVLDTIMIGCEGIGAQTGACLSVLSA